MDSLCVGCTGLCWASVSWQCVKQSRPGWGCLKPEPVGILHWLTSASVVFLSGCSDRCSLSVDEIYFWKLKWELAEWGEVKWQSKFPYFILKAEFPRLAEKRNKCFLDPGGSTFPETEWFIFNSDSSLELLNQKSSDSFIVLRNKGSKLWAMLRLKNLECCRKGEGRFIHLIPAESSPARAWPELQGQHPEARFDSGWKSVWNSTGFHSGVSLDWLRQPSFNSLP